MMFIVSHNKIPDLLNARNCDPAFSLLSGIKFMEEAWPMGTNLTLCLFHVSVYTNSIQLGLMVTSRKT